MPPITRTRHGRHSRRPGLHRLATDHGRQLTTNRRIIKSQSRGRTNHLTPASSGGAASPLSAVTWATTIFPAGRFGSSSPSLLPFGGTRGRQCKQDRRRLMSCDARDKGRRVRTLAVQGSDRLAGHVPARCRGQLSKPRPWPYLKA